MLKAAIGNAVVVLGRGYWLGRASCIIAGCAALLSVSKVIDGPFTSD